MLQASEFHGSPFRFFTLRYNHVAASVVGICWGYVSQAFMIALMIVVADERCNLRFKVTGQKVVFE